MKKIIMVFFMLLYLFSIKSVFAQDQYKLSLHKQDGIYFSRRGGVVTDSNSYYIYKFGNIYAYCIEPGKKITTYNYLGHEEFDLSLSEDVKEKLELIGYYGREYPGHENVKYSMAAQALIWELTGVKKVSFWTGKNETGKEIDISNERNEIMKLVNSHKTLPNFPTNFYGDIKHEMVIEDTNKVLDNFEVVNDGMQDISIKNNKLYIMPKTPGMYNITLRRKNYDEYGTIIFVGKESTSSQKLARLHFSKVIEQDVTISIDGVRLIIHKVDENGKPILKENIKFKIKNLDTGEYICDFPNCEYLTDQEGIVLTRGFDFGEYEIEEVEKQIVSGYRWNNNKLHINIQYDDDIKWNSEVNSHIDLYFSNSEVTGNIEIKKYGEEAKISNNQVIYNKINLENISFSLFDSNNKLIKTFKTDKNGYFKYSGLKVGKYYLVENTKIDKYIDNSDKIYFEIKQKNQYDKTINVKLDIQNNLKKGKLIFNKIDNETKLGIIDTLIGIYNEEDKLLLTRKTDQNGKVEIDNLAIGKYYIMEIDANYYYQKTNDKIFFEIKENNEIVEKNMFNQKIVGNIEIQKYGENYKIIDNKLVYEKNKLANIEFNLYNAKNELINSGKTNEEGYLKFSNIPLGKYYVKENNSNNNYLDNNHKYDVEIKKDSNNYVINVKLDIQNNLKKGKLIFNKIDSETKLGIIDTLIGIYNEEDKLLLTRKTDQNGKVEIDNLAIGKYYIMEIDANYYYQKTNNKVFFEIKENNEIVEKTMLNKKIVGNIEINKKGEIHHFIDNKVIYERINLHGIIFNIFDEKNKLIDSIETDNHGYAKYVGLPLGKYYLLEKTNLDYFITNNQKYYFEIKKDQDNKAINVNLEINNYLKKGTLEFSKEDLVTGEGIPNTIIAIYDINDNLLFTRKTDINGKVIIPNLPLGKYYIIEKEANELYELTNEKVFFEIKENNEIIKAKMTNKKLVGNLEIAKKGESYQFANNEIIYEMNSLEGVEFSLYTEEGKLINTYITDENGYFKVSDLPIGKYYVVETKSPPNYLLDDEKRYFEIRKDHDNKAINVNLEINNYLKKGTLEFSKEDLVTGEGIPNTIIAISDINDNLLFTKKTDINGKVIIPNLPLGKYYIIEKEANELYELTNEKVFFEIKENNEIIKAKMTNEKIIVPVPKTKRNDFFVMNLISLIILIIEIIRRIYVRKKAF